MIKIAVCEDEKETQLLIEDYLENILKDISIEYEIQKYISGEELLESNLKDIDILLLDIKMEKLNGMDTARKIREVDNEMEIIFVTSLIDYVQEGYEIGGGSVRISNSDVQSRMFKALGFTEERANEKFGYLLEAF
ncbi:response regulator, partial [Clostridioides difficile]|uniref:response regulator n=1 Tax=Clostridioides difficile TaxID=1496 RepID=UPI001EED1190